MILKPVQANTLNAPVDFISLVLSLTSVLLLWAPPMTSDTSCPLAYYSITIKSSCSCLDPAVINTINTTATNKTVSGLTQDVEYSFTVAGVDAEGRVGEKSKPFNVILDSQ